MDLMGVVGGGSWLDDEEMTYLWRETMCNQQSMCEPRPHVLINGSANGGITVHHIGHRNQYSYKRHHDWQILMVDGTMPSDNKTKNKQLPMISQWISLNSHRTAKHSKAAKQKKTKLRLRSQHLAQPSINNKFDVNIVSQHSSRFLSYYTPLSSITHKSKF